MKTIRSVGIDIGTSTSQLVFSQIAMEDRNGYFSVPHISIVDKELIYRSPVHETPLVSPVTIDVQAVNEIVVGEYRRAGFSPQDIDTGAVIITGESARKENAAAVLESLSSFAGDFVVSTAGPDLESIIAGKGSGAWQDSILNHCVTANLDIGGGTTNIVIFDDGAVAGTECLDIGGRLVRIDAEGRITSVSDPASRLAAESGLHIVPGERADAALLKQLTDRMAEVLAQVVGIVPADERREALRTPHSAFWEGGTGIDHLSFSGGVADLLNHPLDDDFPYGDIGMLLARSIRESSLSRTLPVIRSEETIQATVVGAGMYTTSLSGSTVTAADPLFPIKNVPVLKLSDAEQDSCFQGIGSRLAEKIRWFLEQSSSDRLILSMKGKRDPDYDELRRLAACLTSELDKGLPSGAPVLIVLEEDMAKVLGGLIRKNLDGRRKLVCLDGIRTEDGDYVDMGRPLFNGLVVPVVIKTLLFG